MYAYLAGVTFIKTLLFILLIVVSGLYISVHYFKSAYVDVGGVNHRKTKVSLRNHPNISSKTVATLGVGEFLSLTQPVGKWKYFYSVNQRLTIQKKNFKLGYSQVFGIFVLKTKQLKVYEKYIDVFAPYFIILLSVLLFLFSFFWFRKRHQISIYNQDYNNTIEPMGTIVEYVEPLPSDQQEQGYRAIFEYFSQENDRKEFEIHEKYQNELAQMKSNLIYEKKEHKEDKEKAMVFGLDLDANNSNQEKGRLFENFIAKIWSKDNRITIEEWTSDKGFIDEIYVKSNGNPDFVVSFKNRKKVAVECKYRKRFEVDSDKISFISFKEHVINRYREYQAENNITVFMLLGVGGSAGQPTSLYLLPLSEIDEINYINNRRCITITREKIVPYQVSKNNLIDSLF